MARGLRGTPITEASLTLMELDGVGGLFSPPSPCSVIPVSSPAK